jgi:hypothetical protein
LADKPSSRQLLLTETTLIVNNRQQIVELESPCSAHEDGIFDNPDVG